MWAQLRPEEGTILTPPPAATFCSMRMVGQGKKAIKSDCPVYG